MKKIVWVCKRCGRTVETEEEKTPEKKVCKGYDWEAKYSCGMPPMDDWVPVQVIVQKKVKLE